jgi:hypothetical protein
MESSQDSPDKVALSSQDCKGPSRLSSKRIKKIFRRIVVGRNFHATQTLPPGSLLVGRGELIQNFEIHRLLHGNGRSMQPVNVS